MSVRPRVQKGAGASCGTHGDFSLAFSEYTEELGFKLGNWMLTPCKVWSVGRPVTIAVGNSRLAISQAPLQCLSRRATAYRHLSELLLVPFISTFPISRPVKVLHTLWAILSSLLCTFLIFHLWSFDRFKCLRWNNGPHSGAFKRVMTYSYLISVPSLMTYAIGFAVIKYTEGFMPFNGTVVPMPYSLWSETSRNAIFPLYLVFSVAWALEMVSHLEELCFWLFLINAGSSQQDWFRSLYFKTWALGSVTAIVYMPIVTIITRSDPLRCEAFTILAGSLGSFSLTLWFLPVLWTFPSFLSNLRREGVDTPTVVRLTKFHELNTVRVIFRFLFCVPFLILGIDGVRPHVHINESMFWTDLLAMVAGFGVVISSGITLVIFFPRSIEGEIASRDAARERKLESVRRKTISQMSRASRSITGGGTYLLTSSTNQNFSDGMMEVGGAKASPRSPDGVWLEPPRSPPSHAKPMRPNRRRGEDVELGGLGALTERNLSEHNTRESQFNMLIHNYTSPINLASYDPNDVPTVTRKYGYRRP